MWYWINISRDIATLKKKVDWTERRRVAIILYHPDKWPACMVIQFKRQTRQEVASKRNIPLRCYLYQLNEFPTVIVLESGGYSTGAEQ